MSNVDDLSLCVAIHQQIGLGVEENRAAHLLGPVIEMRNTPQTRLDSANDDRHIGIRLTGTLGIDDDRPIGPFATLTARGIGVVTANPSIARIAIDHRIHISGCNAEKEVRLAEDAERIGTLPVWLGDDSDSETLRLQQAADDSHPETRVVDVGVARHHDDVAAVPA